MADPEDRENRATITSMWGKNMREKRKTKLDSNLGEVNLIKGFPVFSELNTHPSCVLFSGSDIWAGAHPLPTVSM